MHVPAELKGKNTGRRRKETSKQTGKRISSGLVKIYKYIIIIIIIIIIIVIVKRYICKVYILYRSSGMELPNLQTVLKRLAMIWSPLINEANFLKRDRGQGGWGVSVSLGDLLYVRIRVCLRNSFHRTF